MEDEYSQTSAKMDELKQNSVAKESRFSELAQQIPSLKDNIGFLDQRIRVLDTIMGGKEPEPQYGLDGEYCINGIYHCTNHPPRQVLTNGDEIAEYREMIKRNLEERNRLQLEKQNLEAQYNLWQEEYNQLEAELQAKKENETQYQEQLDNFQGLIDKNKSLCAQEERELSYLLQQVNSLSSQLSDARDRVYNLTKEVSSFEYDFNNIENSLSDAELELQRLNDQYEDVQGRNSRLALLAQQEAMQERGETITQPSREDNARESLRDKLMRLALKEHEEEQAIAASKAPESTSNNDIDPSLSDRLRRLTMAGNSAEQLVNSVRQTTSDVLTTASDIWPSAGILYLKAVMHDAERVVGLEPADQHDGDIIIDKINAERHQAQ